MSTQFTNRQWRLPNEENKSKVSNYSMDFDSASLDYIDAGNPTELQITGELSISLWFKTNTTPSGNVYLLSKGTGSYTQRNFGIWQSNSNTIRAFINGVTSGVTSPSTYADNTWHHCVVTYTPSTSLILYIDGSAVDTNTTSISSAINNNTGNLEIGRWGSDYFNGKLDAVSIYNYALSSSQVTTLYGSSSTGIGNPMSLSPKPVASYNLGDKSAYNSSSYLIPNASLQDYVFDFIPNDYIDCGNSTSLQITSNLTLSTWIKTNSSSFQGIIYKGLYVGTTGAGSSYAMYFNTAGKITLQFYLTNTEGLSSGTIFTVTTSNSYNDGKWHNITAIKNLTSVSLYIDNTLDGTATATLNYIVNSTQNVTIGSKSDGSLNFNGSLSNVSIFNTALPATGSNSVETLYNNGSPLTSMTGFTSLQGWWKLDASATYDGTNWTIPDDSTNSNDGTSSGMTQANLVQSDLSFTSGYSPYALDFDSASSQYIQTNVDLAYTTFPNISLACWVKMNKSDLSNYTIYHPVGVFTNLFPNGSPIRIYSQAASSGGSSVVLVQGSTLAQTSTDLADGNWHHIVQTCEYDSGGTICNVYVDGTKEINNHSLVSYAPLSGNLFIGSRDSSAGFFLGSISNASIWNTALTSAQVSEIYNEGVPSNLNNHSAYSNLVSWWQLGSNSSFNTNWTVLDEKGSNNGTSVNMGEDSIVDGVGSSANGLSSGMGGDEVIGDAPYSSSNSLSVNMDVLDRVTDTPS